MKTKFIPRNEKTRRLIVEKTAGIFNKKGFAGTSLTDLTEATNLTKGSIYGNFENKEAVAKAAFEYNLACVQKIIDKYVNQEITYKGKLRAHILLYKNYRVEAFPEGGCPMQNTAIECDDTNEALNNCATKGLLSWKKDLTEIVTNGIFKKEFINEADPEKIALTIIAMVEGAFLMSRSTKKINYFFTILDSALDFIESNSVKK